MRRSWTRQDQTAGQMEFAFQEGAGSPKGYGGRRASQPSDPARRKFAGEVVFLSQRGIDKAANLERRLTTSGLTLAELDARVGPANYESYAQT